MLSEIQWPDDPPELDVWNHLQNAIDSANDVFHALPDDLRDLTVNIARAIVDIRSRLVLGDGARVVELSNELLDQPWVRFATDLQIAKEGIACCLCGGSVYLA